MAIRLNYTSRKKLSEHEASVRIHPSDEGPATFEARLALDSLRPAGDDARVFIEAYHQSIRMRFDFGKVGDLTPPPLDQLKLTAFDDWELIRFRVKVTDVSDSRGKILAWRNSFRPRGPKDRPDDDLVRFSSANLEGLVWDLDFDEEGPIVQIDPRAGDRYTVGSDQKFSAAVYPEVLRRTLFRAFIVDEQDGSDEDHWSHRWLNEFLKPKLGIERVPDGGPTAVMRWIDDVVTEFAGRHRFWKLWNPDGEGDR